MERNLLFISHATSSDKFFSLFNPQLLIKPHNVRIVINILPPDNKKFIFSEKTNTWYRSIAHTLHLEFVHSRCRHDLNTRRMRKGQLINCGIAGGWKYFYVTKIIGNSKCYMISKYLSIEPFLATQAIIIFKQPPFSTKQWRSIIFV